MLCLGSKDLIDITETVLALHLTASDGIRAGHHKGIDNDHNIHVMNPATLKPVGPHEWDHGTTDYATFATTNATGTVKICTKKTRGDTVQNTNRIVPPPQCT